VAVALYRRAAVRRAAVDRYRTAKFVLWPMLGQTGGDLITAKKVNGLINFTTEYWHKS